MRLFGRRFRFLSFTIGTFLFVKLGLGSIEAKPKLVLASTTSTLDSGLFDILIPLFEKKYNCKVKIIAVGTGQAIRLAKDGNADVLLVHDRISEEKFVSDGYGTKRLDVMHNDFFVIGPKNDPADIKGLTVLNAFQKVSETKPFFISRGDDSGTHKKELSIWKKLNIKPSGSWYIESGTGMETTLRIANEKVAYTLCDRATWLSHKKEVDALDILVEGDPVLFNPYSVIVVSPSKHPWVKYELAKKFADFIRSSEGQNIIKNYGIDKFGTPLFFPDVIK
ncbi:MAG: substrate-binding domain-containing protein [Elusimicrobiota bacterium]